MSDQSTSETKIKEEGSSDKKKSRSNSSRSKDKTKDRSKDRKSSRSSKERDKTGRKRSRRERSPSPDIEDFLKRRKNSGWDQLPTGSEQPVAPPIPATVHNPMLIRSQRKLYVGNIPPEISEDQLVEFFNTAMINAGAVKQTGGPVLSATMNREKAYAFLEFRSSEEATLGMGFDGITLSGQSLRVRRPKDYQPSAEDEEDSALNLNIVSTNVGDSPHKIFVGGIPSDLTEKDVKELLTMFGRLKSFNLVRDSQTGVSKGFAFCEYADPDVTDSACQSLNGMVIGEKTLIVQRASVGLRKSVSGHVNQAAANMLNMAVTAAQLLAQVVGSAAKPINQTRVLVLLNIINIEAMRNPKRHSDTIEDIKHECSKWGKVRSVTIPRPPPKQPRKQADIQIPLPPTEIGPDGKPIRRVIEIKTEYGDGDGDGYNEDEDPLIPTVPGLGKVFVEFDRLEDATQAQAKLSGRRYDGRMVVTSFFDEEDYSKNNLR